MSYINYNGLYLEGLILKARNAMKTIKKYKTFNLSLLQDNQITSLEVVIEEACDKIKHLDFNRYVTARKYCSTNLRSKLDHILAIDDILYNDEKNITIGVDWTTNLNSLTFKTSKHEKYRQAWNNLVDYMCVVCICNEDVLDSLDDGAIAKAVYTILKLVDKEVSRKDFEGYLIIDAKQLV